MKRTELNIASYTDFRRFLADRIAEMKEKDNRVSYRWLADRLGLASKSYLKMVIDGKRKLSPDVASKLPAVLGLETRDADIFRELVRYGQARPGKERSEALARLRRRRGFVRAHRIALGGMDYLGDRLLVTLREMVTWPTFRENEAWIARRLPMRVSVQRIQKSIDKLVSLGFLTRDADGALSVANKHQETGDRMRSVGLRLFYRWAFRFSAEALNLPADRRYLSGLTMAISKKGYEEILEAYSEFYERMRSIVDNDDDADEVYQLVMALAPLTRPETDDQKPDGDPEGGER